MLMHAAVCFVYMLYEFIGDRLDNETFGFYDPLGPKSSPSVRGALTALT